MKADILYYCDVFCESNGDYLFSTHKFYKPEVGVKLRKHKIIRVEMVCKDFYKVFV